MSKIIVPHDQNLVPFEGKEVTIPSKPVNECITYPHPNPEFLYYSDATMKNGVVVKEEIYIGRKD